MEDQLTFWATVLSLYLLGALVAAREFYRDYNVVMKCWENPYCSTRDAAEFIQVFGFWMCLLWPIWFVMVTIYTVCHQWIGRLLWILWWPIWMILKFVWKTLCFPVKFRNKRR